MTITGLVEDHENGTSMCPYCEVFFVVEDTGDILNESESILECPWCKRKLRITVEYRRYVHVDNSYFDGVMWKRLN